MMPREIVLVPIVLLWVLLVWNAKVDYAIEHGDTYLMPKATRDKIVWYLGYGPVIVQGLFIYMKIRTDDAVERRAASPTQTTRGADGPGQEQS